MRLKSLFCLATGSRAISWNFFSSSAPDIEHGQDFSNFFHEVVEEHQEELHEIEVGSRGFQIDLQSRRF